MGAYALYDMHVHMYTHVVSAHAGTNRDLKVTLSVVTLISRYAHCGYLELFLVQRIQTNRMTYTDWYKLWYRAGSHFLKLLYRGF